MFITNQDGREVAAAVRSVLRQTLTALEVIVTPNAADWPAVEQIAATDVRVRRCGPARGRWLAQLDGGDLMHPRRLRDLVARAEADGCDIAADTMLICGDDPRTAVASLPAFTGSRLVAGSDHAVLAKVRPILRAGLLDDPVQAWPGALPVAGTVRLYPQLTYFHRVRMSAALADCAVTVISRQRLLGRANGSSAYLLSLCEAIRRAGLTVHWVSPTPATFGRWPVIRLGPELAVFASIAMRGAWRIGPFLVARDPRVLLRALYGLAGRWLRRERPPAAYAVALPVSRADQLFVARHAHPRSSAIIADYAFLADLIAYALVPDAIGVTVMHDLFSSRAAQFARVGSDAPGVVISWEDELAMLSLADCVLAIQPAEAAMLAPHTRVLTVPMAVDPVASPQPGDSVVLFVGSATAPNGDGLRWFLAEIWPAVQLAMPSAVLTVVGGAGRGIAAAPGLRIAGRVDDLAPLYRDAAVVISPLRVGSGLKIKLVEALGHGKAIVATSVTVQGVEAVTCGALILADAAGPFAAGVIALLHDPGLRRHYGAAALTVARRHFSTEACYTEAVALITM